MIAEVQHMCMQNIYQSEFIYIYICVSYIHNIDVICDKYPTQVIWPSLARGVQQQKVLNVLANVSIAL